jgi:putative chitinase
MLVHIIPECSHVVDKYLDHMNEAFDRFDISTPLRQCAFIAQVGHESSRLTRVEENLNYSSNGLVRTFPNHFTLETSKEFAYKPMRIANKVYANLGGNGDEASGDGWRFRGRGWIQITLKRNYELRGKRLVQDINYFVLNPDKLLEPEWAVRSACDYWDENHLNVYADINSEADFKALTRKINRPMRGLDDRLSIWRTGKKVYGITDPEVV